MKRKINKKLILFSSLITLGLSSSIIIASCTPNKSKTPEKPKQGTENGSGSGSMSGNNTGGTTSGSTGGNNGGSSKNNEQMNGLGAQPQNPENNGGSSGSNTTPTTPSANKNANFSISLPSADESIALDPASNVGYLKVLLKKLKTEEKLDDKVLVVEIKNQKEEIKKAIIDLKIWKENEPITIDFRGLRQTDNFILNNVYIAKKKDNGFGEISKDKQIKVAIPTDLASKQIGVKVKSNKRVLTEEEKQKTPVKFILTESDNKLQLSVAPSGNTIQTIKDKYVRLYLFQLYQNEWTTSKKLQRQIHKIDNNKIDISNIDISEFKKNKDKIAIFVDGIYDSEQANKPSTKYRLDYEDENSLFTRDDELVLIKDFGSTN